MKNGILAILFVVALSSVSEATDNKILHNNLYQEISSTDPDQNIIYSPFSIQACLALAHLGASGVTADEIGHVIGYSSNFNHESLASLINVFDELQVFQVANKIYVKKGSQLNPEYQSNVQNYLKSSVETIDFTQKASAAKTISDWITAKTNNKIKNMIKPNMISELMNMMLVNAVYFKAKWETELNNPRPAEFTNHDQTVVNALMMQKNMHLPVKHVESLKATVVRLPYKQIEHAIGTSMFLVIPDEKNGLKKIEDNIDQIKFMEIYRQMESTFVNFWMPKFEFNTQLKLGDTLRKLGMPTALSADADYTKMFVTKENVPMADVIHEAFIKVDEKGTEAGAATAIFMVGSSMTRPQVTIKADRPFLFAIVADGLPTPLFMGAVKTLKSEE